MWKGESVEKQKENAWYKYSFVLAFGKPHTAEKRSHKMSFWFLLRHRSKGT